MEQARPCQQYVCPPRDTLSRSETGWTDQVATVGIHAFLYSAALYLVIARREYFSSARGPAYQFPIVHHVICRPIVLTLNGGQ
jgi:hypothetical protein